MSGPAEEHDMTIPNPLKAIFRFGPDTSFEVVPFGWTTTDTDIAARGYVDLLDRLAGNINDQSSDPTPRVRHFAASPLADTVEIETLDRPAGRHFKAADLSDLPTLILSIEQ